MSGKKLLSFYKQSLSGGKSVRLVPEPFPDAAENVLHHHGRQRGCINTCAFLFIAASPRKKIVPGGLDDPLRDFVNYRARTLARGLEIPGQADFRFSRGRKKEESLLVWYVPGFLLSYNGKGLLPLTKQMQKKKAKNALVIQGTG